MNDTSMQSETPDLIISVESRKGGVGKTTLALNTAKVLSRHPYNYATLIIDLDMTGTNIGDEMMTSTYWKKYVSPVHTSKSNIAVDLLAFFKEEYMWPTAESLSDQDQASAQSNSLQFQKDKINVIGSSYPCTTEIGDPYTKECSPGVLFDQLHAYWLFEFIKEIANNFEVFVKSTYEDHKKACIIFDNSPGYVGLEPWIHDWITDLGPTRAKVIHVLSLDAQDIIASATGLLEVWRLACKKQDVDKLYHKLCESNEDEQFTTFDNFTKRRLALLAAADCMGTTEMAMTIAPSRGFLKGEGSDYSFTPESFIGIVINRVPDEVFEPGVKYDFNSLSYVDNNNEAPSEKALSFESEDLTNLKSSELFLRLAGDNPIQTKAVRFNPSIANQFLGGHLRITPTNGKHLQSSEVIPIIHGLCSRVDILKPDDWLADPEFLQKTIQQCGEISRSFASVLRGMNNSRIDSTFRSSFFPEYLDKKAADVQKRLLLPVTRMGKRHELSPRLYKELRTSISEITYHLMSGYRLSHGCDKEQLEALLTNCAASLAYCIPEKVWHITTKFGHTTTCNFGALVVYRQATALTQASRSQRAFYSRRLNGQFYANESRYGYYVKVDGRDVLQSLRESQLPEMTNYQFDYAYASLCGFESRFVDLVADTRLLLEAAKIMQRVLLETSDNLSGTLNALKNILTTVIVDKRALHEDWEKIIEAEMETSDRMQAMEDVLKPMLEKWIICE